VAKTVTAFAITAGAALVVAALTPRSASAQAPIQLPPIDVIGTTPLSTAPGAGGPPDITGIDRDKVPASTQTLTPQDFDHAKSNSVPDSLLQRVPSVFNNDTAVNPFQPDVQFRGFVA
jgi:hypothetical protein